MRYSVRSFQQRLMQFDKDIESDFKELFFEAREVLLSHDGIIETKKERITTYSNNHGGICHMRTMPYGIDFGFLKGAKMLDKFGALTGKGKAIRVLSQKGALDLEVINYYVKQAISLNASKK